MNILQDRTPSLLRASAETSTRPSVTEIRQHRIPDFPLDIALVKDCLNLDLLGDQRFLKALLHGLKELSPPERTGLLSSVTGHVAESVASILLVDLGFELLWQHVGVGAHGVDLVLADPTTSYVVAIEVKGTLQPRRWPRLTHAELVQMSGEWLDKSDNPGMAELDLGSSDVVGCVLMINFARRAWRASVTTDFQSLRRVASPADLANIRGWAGSF